MDKEMIKIVICKHCKSKEYFGMMHWLKGKQYCRSCIYEIWEDGRECTRGSEVYTFPKYENGKDYSK